jgi:hypothetical protein
MMRNHRVMFVVFVALSLCVCVCVGFSRKD